MLPPLAPTTEEALQAALPAFAAAGNPLDLTGAATERPAALADIVAALGNDPAVSVVAQVLEVPREAESAPDFIGEALQRVGEGAARSAAPVVVVAGALTPVTAFGRGLLEGAGVSYVSAGLELGLPALGRAAWWSERQRETAGTAPPRPVILAADGPLPSTEHGARLYLAERGVPVVPAVLARTAGEAREAAAPMGGRLALKVASPDIAHKTEVGGVLLDIAAEQAGAAFDRVVAAVRARVPAARLDGVLVSPMRGGGIELLVGVTRDPQWGPVLTVGFGGVLVEVLRDVALRLLPADVEEVVTMLRELRGAPILAGHRGGVPIDLRALAGVIVRIADAALAFGDRLGALEVNPLLVTGDRVEVLDALILAA